VAFNPKNYELTVHTYNPYTHTRLVTIDTKRFDVPGSKLVIRELPTHYNIGPLYINPVQEGHLLAQWDYNQYTGYEDLFDILAKDGNVQRNVTVIPVSDYKGTASTVQVSAVNAKTGEYIMGLLENRAPERQWMVIIDLKSWSIKSVKQIPQKLAEFKLFVTND